ncbi:MAG: methyltransferase domain-containing protein [Candidatus Altiarchaeales archaeon]|nr:methyltransferase domain-containing protein [Candidatus Altiarchaeales archaeon]MBD3417283.1 methyltransferase domain-containing protein [Candidatus Altiarchaeales archaeon]
MTGYTLGWSKMSEAKMQNKTVEANSKLLHTIFSDMTDETIIEHELVPEERSEYLLSHIGYLANKHDPSKYTNIPNWLDSIVNHTGLKDKKILDMGCGFGEWGLMLSNYGNEVTGITITGFEARFLEKIKKIHADLLAENAIRMEPVVGDALDLPFEDSSFDVVLCNQFISHVSDLTRSFEEAKRVLNDNGQLIVLDNNKHNLLYLWRYAPFQEIMRKQDNTFNSLREGIIKEYALEHQMRLSDEDISLISDRTAGYLKDEIIEVLGSIKDGDASMKAVLQGLPKRFRYRNPLTGYYVERYFTPSEVVGRMEKQGFSDMRTVYPLSKNRLSKLPLMRDIVFNTVCGTYLISASCGKQ